MKVELQKLSYRELVDLSTQVKVAIEEKKIAEKTSVTQQVHELIKQSGFEVGDIVGNGTSKSLKGRRIAPKYRNPKAPHETWTGRGRQPKWLAAELERGRPLTSFLIK